VCASSSFCSSSSSLSPFLLFTASAQPVQFEPLSTCPGLEVGHSWEELWQRWCAAWACAGFPSSHFTRISTGSCRCSFLFLSRCDLTCAVVRLRRAEKGGARAITAWLGDAASRVGLSGPRPFPSFTDSCPPPMFILLMSWALSLVCPAHGQRGESKRLYCCLCDSLPLTPPPPGLTFRQVLPVDTADPQPRREHAAFRMLMAKVRRKVESLDPEEDEEAMEAMSQCIELVHDYNASGGHEDAALALTEVLREVSRLFTPRCRR